MRGLPIPGRANDWQVGLEIEFGILANIAAILYPLDCCNGLVMKGMSCVLIPKRRVDDSIQWHVVVRSLQEKLSMEEVHPYNLDEFYETLDLQWLVQSKAFLGLYEKCTGSFGNERVGIRNINRSNAPREGNRYQMSDTMMASMGASASGFWNFTISTKFTKQKGLRVIEEQSRILLDSRL